MVMSPVFRSFRPPNLFSCAPWCLDRLLGLGMIPLGLIPGMGFLVMGNVFSTANSFIILRLVLPRYPPSINTFIDFISLYLSLHPTKHLHLYCVDCCNHAMGETGRAGPQLPRSVPHQTALVVMMSWTTWGKEAP